MNERKSDDSFDISKPFWHYYYGGWLEYGQKLSKE